MKHQILGERRVRRKPDLYLRSAAVICRQDGLVGPVQFEAVLEEHGPHERRHLELVERHRPFEELPYGVAGPEFLDELVGIGEEVVLVVLIVYPVRLAELGSAAVRLMVLVENQMSAQRSQLFVMSPIKLAFSSSRLRVRKRQLTVGMNV